MDENVAKAVAYADGIFDGCDNGEWQTIRARLVELEAENKILRVKCAGSLANNLCPDHRDKQTGKPCIACTIEKLEKRAERTEALLRECRQMLPDYCTALTDRITAHLSSAPS